MLKDTDKYETSSHFSYNDYKKKVQKAPNKDMTLFISVFIVGVLIILGFAKILSPNVDVGITSDDEVASVQDDDNSSNGSVIDDRLRNLQQEDEGKKSDSEDMFSPELDEKVILPQQKRKTVGQMEAELAKVQDAVKNNQPEVGKIDSQNNKQSSVTKPVQQAPKPQSAMAPEQIINAKVVVGYYATEKQAEVAKSIIQDAGLGVTPIVKNLGGYYTLQVGSYSSREKAQQAANGLLKSNFPARVIVE